MHAAKSLSIQNITHNEIYEYLETWKQEQQKENKGVEQKIGTIYNIKKGSNSTMAAIKNFRREESLKGNK